MIVFAYDNVLFFMLWCSCEVCFSLLLFGALACLLIGRFSECPLARFLALLQENVAAKERLRLQLYGVYCSTSLGSDMAALLPTAGIFIELPDNELCGVVVPFWSRFLTFFPAAFLPNNFPPAPAPSPTSILFFAARRTWRAKPRRFTLISQERCQGGISATCLSGPPTQYLPRRRLLPVVLPPRRSVNQRWRLPPRVGLKAPSSNSSSSSQAPLLPFGGGNSNNSSSRLETSFHRFQRCRPRLRRLRWAWERERERLWERLVVSVVIVVVLILPFL